MTALELTLTRIVLGAVAALARRLPVRRELLPLWQRRVGRSKRGRDRGELWAKLAVA